LPTVFPRSPINLLLQEFIESLSAAPGLGLFVAQALNLAVDWRGPWRWILCVGIGIVLVGILVALCCRNSDSFPGRLPTIIVVGVLPASTIALATSLLSSRVVNPVGVRPCIVFAGMFLADSVLLALLRLAVGPAPPQAR
jgi:hypothetical protein